MRPLMTSAMHGRFADLHHDLRRADGDAAQVFVPVGPVADAPVRLLFIGQATKGWGEEELAEYGTAWRRAAEIVARPPSRSGYWQVVRRIVTDVHAQAGLPSPRGRCPR